MYKIALLVFMGAALSFVCLAPPRITWEERMETPAVRAVPISLPDGRRLTARSGEIRRTALALRRLCPPPARWWAEDIHALRLWGLRELESSSNWSGNRLLDDFCDSALMESRYPGIGFHRGSRHGVEIRIADPAFKDHGDPHPDKSLSVWVQSRSCALFPGFWGCI
ncbi:MAG TPA: hypothetical protein VMV69_27575 [Pirellulales bacterium]|nr:hypothetical protein [Pirellulales bacterium]